MAEQRSPETRLARLESCVARLEERLNASLEQRRDWKAEVERRLEENNNNARKLTEERARDRAELITTDLYNSRHSELKSEMESQFREMTARMMEHDRDDNRKHEQDTKDIAELQRWRANIQGRMLAVGAIAAALATLAQLILHAVLK